MKRWYLMRVVGKQIEGDPLRPLIGNVDHEGGWTCYYNEDKTLALVLFETESETKQTRMQNLVKNLTLPEVSALVKTKIDAYKNKLPPDVQVTIDQAIKEGFALPSNEEVEEIGKQIDSRFGRERIENAEILR